MTNDELIRVLASMRTDLNQKRLAVMSVPDQVERHLLDDSETQIERQVDNVNSGLMQAVNGFVALIQILGGHA